MKHKMKNSEIFFNITGKQCLGLVLGKISEKTGKINKRGIIDNYKWKM